MMNLHINLARCQNLNGDLETIYHFIAKEEEGKLILIFGIFRIKKKHASNASNSFNYALKNMFSNPPYLRV